MATSTHLFARRLCPFDSRIEVSPSRCKESNTMTSAFVSDISELGFAPDEDDSMMQKSVFLVRIRATDSRKRRLQQEI